VPSVVGLRAVAVAVAVKLLLLLLWLLRSELQHADHGAASWSGQRRALPAPAAGWTARASVSHVRSAMTGPWSAWMALWLSVGTVVGRDGLRPMLAIKLRSSHARRTQ
jgi:hypothetical protein